MKNLSQWFQRAIEACAVGAATCVSAVTVTPNSFALLPKQAQYVSTTAVSGLVKIKNMNPNVVAVSQIGRGIYRIYALSSGNATVIFSDNKQSSTVVVQVGSVPVSTGSVLTGRLLASNCFQCHGTNGSGGFEILKGQSKQETYQQLKEFANGSEDVNGIMAAHAMGFTDAQLNDIAAYFSTLK